MIEFKQITAGVSLDKAVASGQLLTGIQLV